MNRPQSACLFTPRVRALESRICLWNAAVLSRIHIHGSSCMTEQPSLWKPTCGGVQGQNNLLFKEPAVKECQACGPYKPIVHSLMHLKEQLGVQLWTGSATLRYSSLQYRTHYKAPCSLIAQVITIYFHCNCCGVNFKNHRASLGLFFAGLL